MEGNCLYTGLRPIQEILNDTPKGKHAMFEIVSSKDEFDLGDVVRITSKNKVINMMTDEEVHGIKAEDLRFLRYGNLT